MTNFINVANKQLLVDGNMESASVTPPWTVGNSAILTKETVNPHGGNQVMKIAYGGEGYPYTAQASTITLGKTYRVTGWARGDGTLPPRVGYDYSNQIWIGTDSTEWQYFDEVSVALSTNIKIYAWTSSTDGYTEWDDVVLTEYTPPISITDKQLLADGNMERATTEAWTAGYNATFTKETTNPHGGSKVLRVAYTDQTNPFVYQDILTVGKTYRITGWARGDGTAKPRIQEGLMGGSLLWEGTDSTSWQYFDFVGVTTHSWFILRTLIAGAGYAEFDDVVVTEYTPPISIKDKQLLDDGNMEKVGTTPPWNAANGAVLTKETTNPHGGNQVIRVTWGGSDYPVATQNILTIGKTYRATGWARGDGSIYPAVKSGGTYWTGTTSPLWQYFDFFSTATAVSVLLQATTIVAGYAEFDDVFITEA